jgi:hypothetical protein
LASRFGPADDESENSPVPLVPEDETEAVPEDEADSPEDQHEAEKVEHEPERVAPEAYRRRERSNAGVVAAIWVLTAIASGAIATLHFTGVI